MHTLTQTHHTLMVVAIFVVDCGAVHGLVVHGDDPRSLGSLCRLVRSLQVLFQPMKLLVYQP